MIIYLVQVFLILIIGIGFMQSRNEKGKKRFLFSSFLILVTISGIRGYSVGADTKIYVRWYENIEIIPLLNGRFEAGFILYMRMLHRISSDPGFLLMVSSIICIGTACYFIYRFSKRPIISVLLYFLLGSYFSQMNTMRQSLALSITMWGFMIVLEDKKVILQRVPRIIGSAILLLLASSFHTVAFVAFMPWALIVFQGKKEEPSKLTIQYAGMCTIILAVIVFLGYSLVIRVTSLILPGYVNYFHSTWSDSNYFASLLKIMINITFLLVGAAVFHTRKLTNGQRFSVIMLGLSIIFQALSMRMEIWSRVIELFNIYVYFMWVPEFIDEIKTASNRLIVETGVVGFSFLYMIIILIFRPEWTLVVPYLTR